MTTHAKLSPSKRERWSKCPASVRVEAAYPDDRDNAAAIDGTHTHTLLNWCLMDGLNNIRSPYDQVSLTMKDDDGEFVVDNARAERVEFALNYIRSRIEEINCFNLLSEEKTNPIGLFGRDDLGGTTDVVLFGDVLEIIDYKDGMGVVGAENNPQLEQYLVGIVSPWIVSNTPFPWSKVRLTIIQPKLRERGMTGISYHEFPIDKVTEIHFRITMEAMATDDPDAPFVPGDHCKYCKHKGACTALGNTAMEAVGVNLASLDVAQSVADKKPETMSDDELRKIIEAAPLLRQVIEAAEKEAQRRMESGHPVPGLKLVRGRGSRTWNVSDEEMAAKLKKLGIPASVIWEQKLVSIAKLEKAAWTNKKGEKDQLSNLQLDRLRNNYVSKSEGALTVVPESDPRNDATLSVTGMFPVTEIPDFLK